MIIDRPPHMVSWYSASQGHQQRPWHVSPQPLHQARLHPYQQKPHSQQCNHVIQHYGLWKRRPIITVQDLNSHAGKKKKKTSVAAICCLNYHPQEKGDRMMGSLFPTILYAHNFRKRNWWRVRIDIQNTIGV